MKFHVSMSMYWSTLEMQLSPMWFVANCSSILSLESLNGVAMIPALLLRTAKEIDKFQCIQ